MRKEHEAFRYGDYTLLDESNPRIYAYTRTWQGEQFFIALNFSSLPAKMNIVPDTKEGRVILCNYSEDREFIMNDKLTLRPFEAVVWK